MARAPLDEALREAEERAVAAPSAVREALGDAVRAVTLSLIARQAPVAGDLRLAVAAFAAGDAPSLRQLECLNGTAGLADEQLAEAERVFADRDA